MLGNILPNKFRLTIFKIKRIKIKNIIYKAQESLLLCYNLNVKIFGTIG